MTQLLEFIGKLQSANIDHTLACHRDAIMVIVRSPAEYYEIEFFADSHIEIQKIGPAQDVTDTTVGELQNLIEQLS